MFPPILGNPQFFVPFRGEPEEKKIANSYQLIFNPVIGESDR